MINVILPIIIVFYLKDNLQIQFTLVLKTTKNKHTKKKVVTKEDDEKVYHIVSFFLDKKTLNYFAGASFLELSKKMKMYSPILIH